MPASSLRPPNSARIQPAVPKITAAVAATANSRHADWVTAVPPMWPTSPPYVAQASAAPPS